MPCRLGTPGILRRIGEDIGSTTRPDRPRVASYVRVSSGRSGALGQGHVVEEPKTVASAIRIGNPASWCLAMEAVEESHGYLDMVSDEEILRAYQMVARKKGFCEPALRGLSLAGIDKMHRAGLLPKRGKHCVYINGTRVKDPDTAISVSYRPVTVPATHEAVRRN